MYTHVQTWIKNNAHLIFLPDTIFLAFTLFRYHFLSASRNKRILKFEMSKNEIAYFVTLFSI